MLDIMVETAQIVAKKYLKFFLAITEENFRQTFGENWERNI